MPVIRSRVRLYEQIAEGRMQGIGGRRCQHHLAVTGDLDHPPAARTVGQAQAAQFQIILGRDDDLGIGFDALIAAAELGPPFGENRLGVLSSRQRVTARSCQRL